MAISAKDVMKLRQQTGVGMMECKKALEDANGDFEEAKKLLRERVGKEMDERSDREAGEGVVAVAISDDGTAGAIIQLSSETDFAARNETFVEAARQIAILALDGAAGTVEQTDAMKEIVDGLRHTIKENIAMRGGTKLTAPADGGVIGSYVHHNRKLGVLLVGQGELPADLLTGISQHLAAATPPLMPEPLAVDEDGLPADQVDAARSAAIAEAEASGKPKEIAEKIAEGKLRKWKSDHVLLGQNYLRDMDAKKPIRDYLPKGTKILDFVRIGIGC